MQRVGTVPLDFLPKVCCQVCITFYLEKSHKYLRKQKQKLFVQNKSSNFALVKMNLCLQSDSDVTKQIGNHG